MSGYGQWSDTWGSRLNQMAQFSTGIAESADNCTRRPIEPLCGAETVRGNINALTSELAVATADARTVELGSRAMAADAPKSKMLVLLDTSHDLRECEKEIGCRVEQLLTPLTRFTRQFPMQKFAIDNGAFAGFNPKAFRSLLARENDSRHLCRFVAVPDVVASARRTLEVFRHWKPLLSGWPVALVIQDGQEDLEIPWQQIEAVFIGGTTSYKMSKSAADVIRAAKAIGKWVHAGRVNTPGRFEYFEELGADSIDGTGLSRYSWMRERIHAGLTSPKFEFGVE